jgi:NhaP-type Na+/H+ or K+/H+ antiporter
MFEGFSLIGIDNIIVVDVVYGVVSFFVVVFGSTVIGIVCGFGGGFGSRFTSHYRLVEPMLVFVVCYMSFLLAEMFHLSGILSSV